MLDLVEVYLHRGWVEGAKTTVPQKESGLCG